MEIAIVDNLLQLFDETGSLCLLPYLCKNKKSKQILTALLFEDAVTVGVEEVLEVGDLGTEFLALVGVGDEHAVGGHLYDLGGRLDAGLSAHFAFCLFFLLNRSEWVPVRESEIILISVSLM